MVKQVDCQGHDGRCEFLIRDENENELIEFVRTHIADNHDMSVSPDDVREWITEVPAGGESNG